MEFKNSKQALAWFCYEARNIGGMGNITQRCCDMAKGDYITGTGGALDSQTAKEIIAKVDIENMLKNEFKRVEQEALLLWGEGDSEGALNHLHKKRIHFLRRGKSFDADLKMQVLIRRWRKTLMRNDYLTRKLH